jgi:hypothetical protein
MFSERLAYRAIIVKSDCFGNLPDINGVQGRVLLGQACANGRLLRLVSPYFQLNGIMEVVNGFIGTSVEQCQPVTVHESKLPPTFMAAIEHDIGCRNW